MTNKSQQQKKDGEHKNKKKLPRKQLLMNLQLATFYYICHTNIADTVS